MLIIGFFMPVVTVLVKYLKENAFYVEGSTSSQKGLKKPISIPPRE